MIASSVKHSSLFRFLAYVKPYGGWVCLASAAGVLKSLIPLLIPWGIKTIVDGILTQTPDAGSFRALHFLAAGLIAIYLIWTAASYVRIYVTGRVGHSVIFDLRHDLFLHLQKMSLSFFDRRKIGSVVSHMITDISQAQNIVGQGVTALVMDLSSIAVIAVILFCVHWKLALVSLGMIPFYIWVNRHFMSKIHASSRKVRAHVETLSGNLNENLAALATVQAFAREKDQERDFLEDCRDHLNAALTNVHEQALGLSLIGFCSGIAPILVLWFGAFHVLSGSLTLGTLVAFYAYIGLLYTPLARLSEMGLVISNALAAIERIFEVFDTYPEIQEKAGALELKSVRAAIEFRNVTFQYGSGVCILNHFDLTIKPGETVILIGASGAGKSTIVKLLFRFYEVNEGVILIDGTNICDLRLSSLRDQIALVSQEPILFSGTIFENILYGKPKSSRQAVAEAARAAGAHSFIVELPDQYDTFVGERGATLSVGEKQRIALARAFLKDAPILVLDEPTSALDSTVASEITERLETLMKDRTTLMISHHRPGAKTNGRVIRIQEGKALEERSFSERQKKAVLTISGTGSEFGL